LHVEIDLIVATPPEKSINLDLTNTHMGAVQ
jgi:hypothetical protein